MLVLASALIVVLYTATNDKQQYMGLVRCSAPLQGVQAHKQNMVFFGAAGIAGRPCLHAIVSRSVPKTLLFAPNFVFPPLPLNSL